MASSAASAQTAALKTELVTVENHNRAQTDVNFAGVVKIGGFGKFRHGRELAPPAQQGIVRPNRDTLYSFAIVDLDAGPVTITLPQASKRFMGMQVVNEDQYTRATYYGAGTSHSDEGDDWHALCHCRRAVSCQFLERGGYRASPRLAGRGDVQPGAPRHRSKSPIGMGQVSKRCNRRSSCSWEPRFPIRAACLAPAKMRSTQSSI